MLFSTQSIALLAAVGAVASAEPVRRQATSTTSCAPLHMVIAGGCDLPCPTDAVSYLQTLVNNITAAFPGADQYLVPYNNDSYQARESTPLMVDAIESYSTQCPNTPQVVIGYSLGGIILMNTLCGALPAGQKNLIAAISYGQETYNYPATFDSGTCTGVAPQYPRANEQQACAAYAPIIKDYCDTPDPACCKGGDDLNYHFNYPALYDVKATQFIQSQYAAGNYSSGGSSSSSSSASASSTMSSSSSMAPSSTTTTMSTTSTMSSTVSAPTYTPSSSAPSSKVVSTPSSSTMSTAAKSTSTSISTENVTSTTVVAPSSTTMTSSGSATNTPPTSSAPMSSSAASTTLPPHSTFSVTPYTGAANMLGAGTYIQAFVAVAIYAAL